MQYLHDPSSVARSDHRGAAPEVSDNAQHAGSDFERHLFERIVAVESGSRTSGKRRDLARWRNAIGSETPEGEAGVAGYIVEQRGLELKRQAAVALPMLVRAFVDSSGVAKQPRAGRHQHGAERRPVCEGTGQDERNGY